MHEHAFVACVPADIQSDAMLSHMHTHVNALFRLDFVPLFPRLLFQRVPLRRVGPRLRLRHGDALQCTDTAQVCAAPCKWWLVPSAGVRASV